MSPLKKTSSLLRERHSPLTWLENEEPYLSISALAGVDEVGRGTLAGPVVAAACFFLGPVEIQGVIRDSKKLSAQKRTLVSEELLVHPNVLVGFGEVCAEQIDKINIHRASLEAMRLAVQALSIAPSFVLVDGCHMPSIPYSGAAIVKGDSKSRLIAAASILAKVRRDTYMEEIAHRDFPEYRFDLHKGYATKQHLDALRLNGPCPLHRRSFAPVANTILRLAQKMR